MEQASRMAPSASPDSSSASSAATTFTWSEEGADERSPGGQAPAQCLVASHLVEQGCILGVGPDDGDEVGEHGAGFADDFECLAGHRHDDRGDAFCEGAQHARGKTRLAGAALTHQRHAFVAEARLLQGLLRVSVADQLGERDVVHAQVVAHRRRVEGVLSLEVGQEFEAHAGPTCRATW